MMTYPVTREGLPIMTLTTEQAMQVLGTSDRLLKTLRDLGALKGILLGNKFVYHVEEINQFLNHYAGCDLSNQYTIQAAVKERGLPGSNRKVPR